MEEEDAMEEEEEEVKNWRSAYHKKRLSKGSSSPSSLPSKLSISQRESPKRMNVTEQYSTIQ